MALIALLAALLLEQLRPRTARGRVHRWAVTLTDGVCARAGETAGWLVLVTGAALLVLAIDRWLWPRYPVVVFFAHVTVLYFTIGFRGLGAAFAQLRSALTADQPELARSEFTHWLSAVDFDRDAVLAERLTEAAREPFDARDDGDAGSFADGRPQADDAPADTLLCRTAAAAALVAMHRHLFAPLFWYLILPGVLGPVLYRVCAFLEQRDSEARHPRRSGNAPLESRRDDSGATPGRAGLRALIRELPGALRQGGPRAALRVLRAMPRGLVAERALARLDWPAVRFSAAGFAIMGNFEDAWYCWRAARATSAGDDARALLLAAGAGALGVRLADERLEARWAAGEQGFEWLAAPADARTLRSAVGLIWRAAALWICLFGLLTVAGWLGR